jgi:hypothetical protein
MLFPVAGFMSTFSVSGVSLPVLAVTRMRIPLLKEMVDEGWAQHRVTGKANTAVKIRTEIRRRAGLKRSS